jgi:hypothetical protein
MAKRMGRRAIFDFPKTRRLQGVISGGAAIAFTAARRRLKKLAKWKGKVSDADTIEFLARGEAWTVMYLEGQRAWNRMEQKQRRK